jgi:hypothetical protein
MSVRARLALLVWRRAVGWMAGVQIVAGADFLFSIVSRLVLGTTQPPIKWARGAVSPGVKRLGCEADYYPVCPHVMVLN